MKKITALLLAILTFALIFTGCGSDKEAAKNETTAKSATEEKTNAEKEGFTFPDDITILGAEGSKYSFIFKAVHKDGEEKTFGIRTDKETVGEALVEADLLGGREESTGYVVYTIDHVKHDHNTEGFYWVLYIDGELAEVDVMKTALKNGSTYEFICERYMK